MWQFIHKMASPKFFYRLSSRLLPWLSVVLVIILAYGLIGGLYLAPPDYQQGHSFRIIYIHVPSAFLSLMVYAILAISAAVGLIWKIKLADIAAKASAPLGACFTFLALATGALWGKPMWGTWWIWDARLASELILLFLYFGYMALHTAIVDKQQAARASAIVALMGVVNLPIIHYSVVWWNTLHQGATLSKFEKPSIAPAMLYPLLAMICAFVLIYSIALLVRMRYEIVQREKNSQWVQELIN